jgi:small-conductance mechanosensitive channel
MSALPYQISYQSLFEGLGLLSAATFLISLLLIPFLISKASADYFLTHATIIEQRHKRHPAVALLIKIIRNSLGIFLCLAGFLMLFLPGQGLLTILIGASLLDVPGRQKIFNMLIHRHSIQYALNWIRKKTKHPPFQFPEK